MVLKAQAPNYTVLTLLTALFLSPGSSHPSETRTMAADDPGDHLSSTSTSGGRNIIISSSSDSGEASSTSLRGISRLLAQYYNHPRAPPMITCNNFPRICRGKGSPGPDCCKKQCVNVMTDGRNCGWCGNKCRYGEACCRGDCINIMYDRKNCGGCRKRCKKGSYCRYGMCSYA